MNLTESIAGIFPAEADIPEFFRLDNPVDQCEYLVNGELRRWSGPMQEVRSPVYVKTAAGLTQKVVGRYPLQGEPEALEALEAAVKAYDHGHGLWPSLSVSDRISHVEDFIFRIIARKDEVVKTLMWEIGKPYGDSAKEFDRTVAYMQGHHRRPEGPGPHLVPLCHGTGHLRPDPAGAPGSGPVHGALQLPAE